MNLNELYTQVITENSRSKENRHPVENATHSLEGVIQLITKVFNCWFNKSFNSFFNICQFIFLPFN